MEPYGVECVVGEPTTRAIPTPDSEWVNSSASRVLPMPAGPSMTTPRVAPTESSACSTPNRSSRPTNGHCCAPITDQSVTPRVWHSRPRRGDAFIYSADPSGLVDRR